MELNTDKNALLVYQALANETRLAIIELLGKGAQNIQSIAKKLGVTNALIYKHINQLENAGLVCTKKIPAKSGTQRMCHLVTDTIHISFPNPIFTEYKKYETSIAVGHFTNYKVKPTCGIASHTRIIGALDDPKFFMDSERINADIIWFTTGFLEYKTPNPLDGNQKLKMIEISFEIASEFPVSNNVWPSDITFYVNNQEVGTWTVPGNFSDVPGKLNPSWWPRANSQYGLLKHLRITENETLMDGQSISNITTSDIMFEDSLLSIKFEVKDESKNPGGLTIFGKSFGNHPQDIQIRLFYK